MARELTNVEKNIIRAIYEEAGPSSTVTYLCELAAEANAKAEAAERIEAEQIDAATAKVKADERANLEMEQKTYRAAKRDEIEQASRLTPSEMPATPSALVAGLTVRQAAMLVKIAEDECHDGDPTGPTWATGICRNHADNALVSGLSKKGMVICVESGREATIQLTKKGLDAYLQARPDSAYAVSLQTK